MISERHLFNPHVMTAHNVALVRNTQEGNDDAAKAHGVKLLQEQFELSTDDAVTAQELHDIFEVEYIAVLSGTIPQIRSHIWYRTLAHLGGYHDLISSQSGLQYNVVEGMYQEFMMYIPYLAGDFHASAISIASFLSTVYSVPGEEILAAANARAAGIKLIDALDPAKADEIAWQKIEKSFASFYHLLYQALNAQIQKT